MSPRIRAFSPHGSLSPESQPSDDVDISDIDIILVCNDDHKLASLIVNQLRKQGARNIRICYPYDQIQEYKNINAYKIPSSLESQVHFDWNVASASIVISLFYNDFEKQEMLFNACIRQEVSLFVTWDSGMELDHLVKDKECPRTRLHEKLLNSPCDVHWILFQTGIFDEEILKHDISAVATAFNSPNQYIFLNVTVKEDFAQLIAESIISKKVQINRSYIVGDFISHSFLGHAYRVANRGVEFDYDMPATLTEFEVSNQIRLTGIVSFRPLPRILYPSCSVYFQKLAIETSFQHDAIIYKILKHHRQIPFKEWVCNRIFGGPTV